MTNIEIYGFRSDWSGSEFLSSYILEVKSQIRAALKNIGLSSRAVITLIDSQVERCDSGGPVAHIRVIDISPATIRAVVSSFRSVGLIIGVETLVLSGLIGAENMASEVCNYVIGVSDDLPVLCKLSRGHKGEHVPA